MLMKKFFVMALLGLGLNSVSIAQTQTSEREQLFQTAQSHLQQNQTDKALPLLEKSAEHGFAPAQFALGEIYQSGANGIEANPKLAEKYFMWAMAQGYQPAGDKWRELQLKTK